MHEASGKAQSSSAPALVVVRACLDDGPVRVGVVEGHAELDDVGAAGVQESQRLRRRGQVGVAGGDVRDERRLRSRTYGTKAR